MKLPFLRSGIAALLLIVLPLAATAADSLPPVQINTNGVGPRGIEALTSQSIVRDYSRAWRNLADAFNYRAPSLLDAYFTGNARATLGAGVAAQKIADLHSRYLGQNHKLEAVFYSPEGDVMELHDTAQVELELTDGDKVIHREQAVRRYVVLMTPAADRWVIRQLQEVDKF